MNTYKNKILINSLTDTVNFLMYARNKAETKLKDQLMSDLLSMQMPCDMLNEEELAEIQEMSATIESLIDDLFTCKITEGTITYNFRDTTLEEINQAIETLHKFKLNLLLELSLNDRLDYLKG